MRAKKIKHKKERYLKKKTNNSKGINKTENKKTFTFGGQAFGVWGWVGVAFPAFGSGVFGGGQGEGGGAEPFTKGKSLLCYCRGEEFGPRSSKNQMQRSKFQKPLAKCNNKY